MQGADEKSVYDQSLVVSNGGKVKRCQAPCRQVRLPERVSKEWGCPCMKTFPVICEFCDVDEGFRPWEDTARCRKETKQCDWRIQEAFKVEDE